MQSLMIPKAIGAHLENHSLSWSESFGSACTGATLMSKIFLCISRNILKSFTWFTGIPNKWDFWQNCETSWYTGYCCKFWKVQNVQPNLQKITIFLESIKQVVRSLNSPTRRFLNSFLKSLSVRHVQAQFLETCDLYCVQWAHQCQQQWMSKISLSKEDEFKRRTESNWCST